VRTQRINGVDLAVQTYGERSDPPIVLIAGAGSSMEAWDPRLCQRLAAGPRFVIRYDQRDTGESTTDPPGAPSYRFTDLVDDVIGLLDHFGLPEAHLVGVSMGGAVALLAALTYPNRVASLTLVATTTGPGGPELPGLTPALREYFATRTEPDWADQVAVVEYLVGLGRALSGEHFDEAAARAGFEPAVARSRDVESGQRNHVLLPREEPWRPRLSTLDVPTLVIHGTIDPLFPLEHGQALATEIPGAQLLTVAGMGHEVPPPSSWDTVVPAILFHTSGGWDRQADRLAARALAAGDATAWFEPLYASAVAGEVALPWDTEGPRPALVEWAEERAGDGRRGGRRALVVGCGLGQNSEYIARLGYVTDAFDISATAIEVVRHRFPDSPVRYRTADLFDPPPEWWHAFDLVVEVFTVQALPTDLRAEAIAAVAGFTAPGGTLIVIARMRAGGEPPRTDPPWPLTRAELDSFTAHDLSAVRVEALPGGSWRAEFHRPLMDRPAPLD
jgi:pimeloyl-ACP methyl ester carboxylesterase/SAM-dependent methyltransferase